MKFKKIIITMLALLVSIPLVKAETDAATCNTYSQNIDIYSKAYVRVATLMLYENDRTRDDAETKLKNAITKVQAKVNDTNDAYLDFDTLNGIYANFVEIHEQFVPSLIDQDNNSTASNQIIKDAANFKSMVDYVRYFDAAVSIEKANYKNGGCSGATYEVEEFDNLKKELNSSITDFCAYLRNSTGITGFIKTALNIVSYVAMALAIILGILDFIKAISSNEDNGLKKAFGTFMKRVVAVILIFCANLIVIFIINLIPIRGVNADKAICDEIGISSGGIF